MDIQVDDNVGTVGYGNNGGKSFTPTPGQLHSTKSIKTPITYITSGLASLRGEHTEPEVFYNINYEEMNDIKMPINNSKRENFIFDEDDLFSRLNKISQISENPNEDVTNNESFNISCLKTIEDEKIKKRNSTKENYNSQNSQMTNSFTKD